MDEGVGCGVFTRLTFDVVFLTVPYRKVCLVDDVVPFLLVSVRGRPLVC